MNNKLGICNICKGSQAKYKCPTCLVTYCSLSCFKNKELHKHENVVTKDTRTTETTNSTASTPSTNNSKFNQILCDPHIKSMLRYKSLQFHLLTLIKILNEFNTTNETSMENRREVANLKLCNLRMGGSEENQLVEEFVQRILYLYNKL